MKKNPTRPKTKYLVLNKETLKYLHLTVRSGLRAGSMIRCDTTAAP